MVLSESSFLIQLSNIVLYGYQSIYLALELDLGFLFWPDYSMGCAENQYHIVTLRR